MSWPESPARPEKEQVVINLFSFYPREHSSETTNIISNITSSLLSKLLFLQHEYTPGRVNDRLHDRAQHNHVALITLHSLRLFILFPPVVGEQLMPSTF